MMVGIGAVEDHRHIVVLLVLIVLLQLGEHGALQEAGADNKKGDVALMADDGGIGNNLHGGTVDEDIVVKRAQLVEHGLETGTVEQLGGVGGHLADGENV